MSTLISWLNDTESIRVFVPSLPGARGYRASVTKHTDEFIYDQPSTDTGSQT